MNAANEESKEQPTQYQHSPQPHSITGSIVLHTSFSTTPNPFDPKPPSSKQPQPQQPMPPLEQQQQQGGPHSPRGVASPTNGNATTSVVVQNPIKGDVSSSSQQRVPIRVAGSIPPSSSSSEQQPHDDTMMDHDDAHEYPEDSHNNSGNGQKSRRQKRLERNRESARLSRRRRKQYLEVLEERVSQLSHEMDAGRRHHVSQAVPTVRQQRLQAVTTTPSSTVIPRRISPELQVADIFRSQQWASFCAPPSTKVTLWLTLQNDDFFRGGRAASERLSAARIGERMLQNGNDKVTPAQTMWPLLCNEIGLSYDQEEKVRLFQRALLHTQETWVSRHTQFAATQTMKSCHTVSQALALAVGNRERSHASVLRSDQSARLHQYLASKKDVLAQRLQAKTAQANQKVAADDQKYPIAREQHVAANLYVLNHRLNRSMKNIPQAAPLIVGPALKKLSRRPSFESLGARSGTDKNPEDSRALNRENTFPSSGSLKRSASEMSMDGADDRHHRPTVDPMEAQTAARELVDQRLGHVKEIMVAPRAPTIAMTTNGVMPPRAAAVPPVSSGAMHHLHPGSHMGIPELAAPSPLTSSGVNDPMMDDTPTFEFSLPDPVPVSVLSATPAPPYAVMSSQPAPAPAHMPAAHTPVAAPLAPEPIVSTSFAAGNNYSSSPAFLETSYESSEPKPKRSTSSFFPPNLGVVPEEMWSADAAEDFLMGLADEDWAIGEGVETDF